jgi:signal transduction histidine kinase
MTDAERVLQALLHDVRTPIGVAQGYLRLVQEGHVASGADQERAISKALNALGQTARICQDAAEFLDTSSSAAASRVSAAVFANQVETSARHAGLDIAARAIIDDATVQVAGSLDLVCDAIITVVASSNVRSGSKRASGTLHMRADSGQLRVAAAAMDAVPDFDSTRVVPMERFWSRGLAMAVACRRITRSSGQIVALEADNALMVAFPLENSAI